MRTQASPVGLASLAETKEFSIAVDLVVAERYCINEFRGWVAFNRVAQAHDLYTGIVACLKIIRNDLIRARMR